MQLALVNVLLLIFWCQYTCAAEFVFDYLFLRICVISCLLSVAQFAPAGDANACVSCRSVRCCDAAHGPCTSLPWMHNLWPASSTHRVCVCSGRLTARSTVEQQWLRAARGSCCVHFVWTYKEARLVMDSMLAIDLIVMVLNMLKQHKPSGFWALVSSCISKHNVP